METGYIDEVITALVLRSEPVHGVRGSASCSCRDCEGRNGWVFLEERAVVGSGISCREPRVSPAEGSAVDPTELLEEKKPFSQS